MARRGISEPRQRAAFIQGGQQMIARGERPLYRLRSLQEGRWQVDGCPWLVLDAGSWREAVDAARATVAAMLVVEPDGFDVETT